MSSSGKLGFTVLVDKEKSQVSVFSLSLSQSTAGTGYLSGTNLGNLRLETKCHYCRYELHMVMCSDSKGHRQCDLTNTVHHSARESLIFLGITV